MALSSWNGNGLNFNCCNSLRIDLISVFQNVSELVIKEKFWFSRRCVNKSSMALCNSGPCCPLACMLKELSSTRYMSLRLFLLSFALKKGWAKAKIKKASSSKRVASNNHFLIVALFRVWMEISFKKRTLLKYSFLKRRNWNKWTNIGMTSRNRKYRISGCLNCMLMSVCQK